MPMTPTIGPGGRAALGGGPRRRFLILGAVFVTVVVNYLDRTNIAIAAIGIRAEFGLTPVEMGMILSAFAWTYSLCQIPGGLLADRVRPRLLYPVLLVAWSLATVVQGFAASVLVLVVCRALVGVFEAPSFPLNNRIVTSWFPAHERAGAIGFYTSGQFLGLAAMAPILVAFQAAFGWRALFFACGAVGIVWAWAWHLLYRDPDLDEHLTDDERDRLRSGGALVDRRRRDDPARPRFRPGDLRHAFSHPSLWGIYLAQFCIGSLTIFFLTWFPTYLVDYRGIAFDEMGYLAAMPFVAAFAGVILSGLMSDALVRRGVAAGLARKAPVLTGMMLSTTIVGAAFVKSDGMAVGLMALAFFGNGLASISWVFVSLLAPKDHLGLVGGVFNFIGGLSAVVTPMVIGLLVDGSDFSAALIYVSAVALAGCACYIFLVGAIERVQVDDPAGET